MKKFIIIIGLFFLSSNVLSEEILRSVVIPLTEEDYKKKLEEYNAKSKD